MLPVCHFQGKGTEGSHGSIVATHPLELVHTDYLCLEPGKGREENVMMVTDHLTQYAQAYITQSEIFSNQGRNFESELFLISAG